MTEDQSDRTVHDTETSGHLLGGGDASAQPRRDSGAASSQCCWRHRFPSDPGESVVEGGTGAGATLLCLAARIPRLRGVGIERDHRLVSLARRNAVANRQPDLHFIVADMAALPDTGVFDHGCANPPYHSPAGTASPTQGARLPSAAMPALFSSGPPLWHSA